MDLRIIVLALVLSILCYDKSLHMEIEDKVKAAEVMGQVSGMEIVFSEKADYAEARTGYQLVTDISAELDYLSTVQLFTGLSPEEIELKTEEARWGDKNAGTAGSSKSIKVGKQSFRMRYAGEQQERTYAIGYENNSNNIDLIWTEVMKGELTELVFNNVYLRERFPKTDLEEMTSEQAIRACQPYLDAIGFTYDSVDVYAMTQEDLSRIQREHKVQAPEKGKWLKEDECILLLFHAACDGEPIFDIRDESMAKVLYSPTSGLVDLQYMHIHYRVLEQEEKILIAPKRVFSAIDSMAAAWKITGRRMEITEVRQGYVAPFEYQNEKTTKGLLMPAYQICYVLTRLDGSQVEGYFIVDATNGFMMRIQ